MSWSQAWSTQQLVEFTAALSSCPNAGEIARQAVERAAEALDADVGALIYGGQVPVTIGFPGGYAAEAAVLLGLGSGSLSVPGVGTCPVLSAPVNGVPAGRLLLARSGADGFSVEETSLLRGMGRVMSLALGQLELVEQLRSRQQLLEQLGIVQRALARRAPLQDVLDAITAGAGTLLAADVVALRLVDADDPERTRLVSARGMAELQMRQARQLPIAVGLIGRAIATQQLISVTDYDEVAVPAPEFAGVLTAAMAAPVLENNRTVGALLVAGTGRDWHYSPHDQQTLTAFADHVSLALSNAHTMAAVVQARHDPLTGLPNRGLIVDRLARELSDAARSAQPTSVLFLDLDEFKTVNDTLGHASGDELLITVAARIRTALRNGDGIGRLGGDEFAVLLPGANTHIATQVAERVLRALRRPVLVGFRLVPVEVSIGLATTGTDGSPTQGTSPRRGPHARAVELLRHADLAMYRAKSHTGPRYEVFAPAMSHAERRRVELHEDLTGALDAGQLWLALQPIVDLRTDRPVGAEALLRWAHPTRGLIAPQEFVPLAEQSGLLDPIGRWVLRQACALAAGWVTPAGGAPMSIAVNLSACQLTEPSLIDDVTAALGDCGLDPPRLTLEITESMLVRDIDTAAAQLHRLKALGVQLAIDDFGTGYSSLAYLARFPFDILKIDRSFVAGMTDSPQAALLTEAIVRLAEFMHLQVIAEGIETAAQLQQARDLNCAFGQGYHLGLPDRAVVFPQRSYPPGEPTADKTAQEKGQSRLGDGNHEPAGSCGASGGQPQPQRPPGDQRRR